MRGGMDMIYEPKPKVTPVWEKDLLTLEEAIAYTGIGGNKLIELANKPRSKLAVWKGASRFFRRVKLEEFIDKSYSI